MAALTQTVQIQHQLMEIVSKQILGKIAKEVADMLRTSIMVNIYNRPEGNYYERTEELLNSLTTSQVKCVGDTCTVEIYIDTDKIKSHLTEPGMWNQHMSMDGSDSYGGKTIGEWLPLWFDQGAQGANSPYWTPKTEFFSAVVKTLKEDDYLRVRMKEILARYGLNAKGVF